MRKSRKSRPKRPRVVGVISSLADLSRAIRMRAPPDLFELRLDHLAKVADQLQRGLADLRAPLIITARHPREGGANKLSVRQRHDLLMRFLLDADYLDVELRSVPAMRSLLASATRKRVRRIISFHDFKATPSVHLLATKAHNAKALRADIFKVATRTDTAAELGRLLEFMTESDLDVPLAVMGIGKLGAISRVLLTRAGSTLVYASMRAASNIEGQLSLEQLRALGINTITKHKQRRVDP
jgi:3-dehydroquinate dehydratase-1